MTVIPQMARDSSVRAGDRAAVKRPRRSRSARTVHRRGGRPRPLLAVRDLHVQVAEREILRGVTLTVRPGEVAALMGPNGSGKTTLAHALAGLRGYHVTAGRALLRGRDLLAMEVDERARAGLFVAYQYPVSIPGVRMVDFLRLAVRFCRGEAAAARFDEDLAANMKLLDIDRAILRRYLNEGFSGGEKKRAEILQMAMLKPAMALLDETDSGLDVDALQTVGEGVRAQLAQRPEMGVLVVTHYPRLLRYLAPRVVYVMAGGRVIRSGDAALAGEIEAQGFGWLLNEAGLDAEAAELDPADRAPAAVPDPFRATAFEERSR